MKVWVVFEQGDNFLTHVFDSELKAYNYILNQMIDYKEYESMDIEMYEDALKELDDSFAHCNEEAIFGVQDCEQDSFRCFAELREIE